MQSDLGITQVLRVATLQAMVVISEQSVVR